MNDLPSLTAAERYALVRQQIEHEDTLISQRLSWFIMSQSFLFTAFAITVANTQAPPAGLKQALVVLIPAVAVSVCLLIFLSIVAGVLAMHQLRRDFRARAGAADGWPPIQGRRHTQVLGLAAPLLLPWLFTGVWLFLLASGVT